MMVLILAICFVSFRHKSLRLQPAFNLSHLVFCCRWDLWFRWANVTSAADQALSKWLLAHSEEMTGYGQHELLCHGIYCILREYAQSFSLLSLAILSTITHNEFRIHINTMNWMEMDAFARKQWSNNTYEQSYSIQYWNGIVPTSFRSHNHIKQSINPFISVT